MRKVRVFSDLPPERGGPTIDALRASPDGRRFLFARSLGESASSIYVVNADGSGLKQIANVCLGSLEWAPTGKRLLASWTAKSESGYCLDKESGIYLFSPAGGPKTRIFTEKKVETGPGAGYGVRVPLATFSPDGTRVAFVVQRLTANSGLWDTVMVMRANGGGVRQVLRQSRTRRGRSASPVSASPNLPGSHFDAEPRASVRIPWPSPR
jgi:Tol biopolymer transport system component